MPRWAASYYSDPSTEQGKIEASETFNFVLLYSCDVSGNDMKLHLRIPYDFYSRPLPEKWGDKNSSLLYKDGEWYFVSPDTWIPPSDPAATGGEHLDPVYYPLSDYGFSVSDEDIGGFLSPSDEWYNFYGKAQELSEKYHDIYPNTTGVLGAYTRQWFYENGYRDKLYLSKEERNAYVEEKRKEAEEQRVEANTVSSDMILYPGQTIDANVVFAKEIDKLRVINTKVWLFVSTNKKVAKVSKSKGLITAKGEGEAVIKVKMGPDRSWFNGYKKDGYYWPLYLKVIVKKPYLTTKKATVPKGSVIDIGQYLVNGCTTTPTVTCSKNLAMDGDGIITAQTPGKGVITFSFGKKYKLKLKVVITE